MQNILSQRQTILESVNVGALLESFNPASVQGTTLKKLLVESFNKQHLQSITSLTQVVFECNQLRHLDNEAFNVGEQITEHLADSIEAKIVYCFESLSLMNQDNKIVTGAMNQLDNLLSMSQEQIVNSIRSGSLNPFKSMTPIHFIIESVKVRTEDEESTAIHEAYHPISYFEERGGNIFVRLFNKVFAINENQVYLTNVPSSKFAFLSSIVESLSYNYEKNSFACAHPTLGSFTISENMITRQASDSETILEFHDTKSFLENSQLILEAQQTKRTTSNVSDSKFIDSIITIHENFDSLTIADNIVIVEDKRSNDKFALLLTENKSYVATLHSNKYPNVVESFNDIKDALKSLQAKSGYDAKHFVTEKLLLLEQQDEEIKEKSAAYQVVIEGLKEKETEIKNMINVEKAQVIVNEAKIEKLKEGLSELSAYIIEQQTELSAILSK